MHQLIVVCCQLAIFTVLYSISRGFFLQVDLYAIGLPVKRVAQKPFTLVGRSSSNTSCLELIQEIQA